MMSEWIKVSDRLPELHGDAIVCDTSATGRAYVTTAWLSSTGEWFEGESPLIGVTHWQPFPALPDELEPQEGERR
jgi:hypothetical protein